MISFEKIQPNDIEQANAYISWCSDPEMIKNWVLQKEDSVAELDYTLEKFKEDFSHPDKSAFMIKDKAQFIGYASFYINHPVAIQKTGRVCWPSIAIGEKSHRGKGFGLQLCAEVLKLAKDLKCTHIEAGIFEFNIKMKKILVENNFKLIGSQPNKTFVDSKWWNSEHYLLKI